MKMISRWNPGFIQVQKILKNAKNLNKEYDFFFELLCVYSVFADPKRKDSIRKRILEASQDLQKQIASSKVKERVTNLMEIIYLTKIKPNPSVKSLHNDKSRVDRQKEMCDKVWEFLSNLPVMKGT